jgi:hypothetical protein
MCEVRIKKNKVVKEPWLNKYYQKKYNKIRKSVIKIYKISKKTLGELPYFTPHGRKHCQEIVNILHKLIPKEHFSKLSMKERFYLLTSAWLHDLGMLPLVYKEIYNDENPNDHLNDIRKNHHKISEKYIVNNWAKLQISEDDKELLGKLCRFHRRSENINECDKEFIVKNDKIRLRLLGAYLRLADSLDITSSRTFSEAYAICLAYDIPEESKLHWIKSKLVNGIDINLEEHKITIYFKEPILDETEPVIDNKQASEKLADIIKLVTDDLKEELASIINILTRYGITYFLDIEPKKTKVFVDRQILNDLRELVLNFDIMNNPSATKLLEIILVTISNILGYYFQKSNDTYQSVRLEGVNQRQTKFYKEKVNDFIKSVNENILKSRPCHIGLVNIIHDCSEIFSVNYDEPSINIVDKLNHLYNKHQNSRNSIRSNAKNYFDEKLKSIDIERINILLYGFSELVTKAILGLRDSLINMNYKGNTNDIYSSKLEKKSSDLIHFYICDGQPKTQTGYNDHLIYHDGSQLALYLKRRGFSNITIIPDLISNNLIEMDAIDYIFLGANGIKEGFFKHSAGHQAIIELARMHRENKKEEYIKSKSKDKPEIILVSSSEKVVRTDCTYNYDKKSLKPDVFSNDIKFGEIPKMDAYRYHLWMPRDNQLLATLYEENILFANPREDDIKIEKIDTIISDKKADSIKGVNTEDIISEFFHDESNNKTIENENMDKT